MARTASTGGTAPARAKVAGTPISSLTGPASAMDTGMNDSETKKSRLETRPSIAGGTRRCSRVPQMTVAASKVAPTAAAATTMTHSSVATPNRARGRQPAPHSMIITVR
jgi:hypothetical protein